MTDPRAGGQSDFTEPEDETGRRVYASFDAALNDFHLPLENVARVREFLAGREYSEFYIPPSGSYVAAVPRDGIKKAYINSGFIWHRTKKGEGETVWLPTNGMREDGGTRTSTRDRPRSYCDSCTMELPASGVCSYC